VGQHELRGREARLAAEVVDRDRQACGQYVAALRSRLAVGDAATDPLHLAAGTGFQQQRPAVEGQLQDIAELDAETCRGNRGGLIRQLVEIDVGECLLSESRDQALLQCVMLDRLGAVRESCHGWRGRLKRIG